jgi:mono/diheme cytochrome c family protein
MRTIHLLAVLTGFAATAPGAIPIPGDSRKGAEVFETQQCIACHSINGKGGKSAPDLGKRASRNFTPALMASLMWNHAPKMWSAMSAKGIAKPQLTTDQAADLFAYFYSLRYFEQPGDAGRGKLVFSSKKCAECHGVTSSPVAGAPPVAQWKSASDPILLAQEMWNHSARMREAMAKKNLSWPQITSQELTDLLIYVQNLPETKGRKPEFAPASAETGRLLFDLKGCQECHTGRLSLERRFVNRTVTDFAVAMWNHSPKMKQPPPELRAEEMRRIVGYLWSQQVFDESGSSDRGKAVFTAKNCAGCHVGGGAPSLTDRQEPLNALSIVSELWKHGPAMQEQLKAKNLAWPHFAGSNMSDLLAYLNVKK